MPEFSKRQDKMNAIRNFFLLFIACASLNAATIPPAPNQYFNDYAGLKQRMRLTNYTAEDFSG
jgi:hypothetical protein